MPPSRVVALGSKRESAPWYDAALDAYARGDLALAERLVAVDAPMPASQHGSVELLRARLARSRRDVEPWYAAAVSASRDHPTPRGRLTATALAAAAARALEDHETADRLFAEVDRRAVGDARSETAFAAYLRGVDFWERRSYDEAEAAVASHLAGAEPDINSRSLLGWIAIKRGRFAEAGTHFAAALGLTEYGVELGALGRANVLQAGTMTAAETADVRLGRRFRKAFDETAWTPALAAPRFLAGVNVRVLALLEGDLEQAWFLSRDAVVIAPSGPYAAMAEINAAVTSRLLGDDRASRLQFRAAWQKIRAERWGAATEEERVALTGFAAEAAHEMPAEARQALTMYQSLRAKRAKHLSLDDDPRVDAYTAFARGRLAEARNAPRAEVLEFYGRALDVYEGIGLELRVGMAAAELFRLTHADEYRAIVDRAMARAPKAWIRPTPTLADDLGPKAREILARLLLGESAKMIAADTGRSTFTVTNHTRRIFEVFGVRSRDALREKCAKLGITSATLRAR